MDTQDYTTTLVVEAPAAEAFAAVTNVRGWWSRNIVGRTDHLGEEWTYAFQAIHRCRLKTVELVAGQKVVWQVLDSFLDLVDAKDEWTGTRLVVELSPVGGRTRIRFTHQGLVRNHACFDLCASAWDDYVQESLGDLIRTGEGQPNPAED